MKPRLPKTRAEWQDAVDGAFGALALDAARQYGLVTGGPVIDQTRCAAILRLGADIGIRPRKDSAQRFIDSVNVEPAKAVPS